MAIKLSITELDQVLSYCEHREQEGWYYGEKGMFEHRHARIKKFLNQQLAALRGEPESSESESVTTTEGK